MKYTLTQQKTSQHKNRNLKITQECYISKWKYVHPVKYGIVEKAQRQVKDNQQLKH